MTTGKLLKFLRDFGGPVKMDTICLYFAAPPPVTLVVLRQLMALGKVERPSRGYYMAVEAEDYKPPKQTRPAKHNPKTCPRCKAGFCTARRAEALRKAHKDKGYIKYMLPSAHIVS